MHSLKAITLIGTRSVTLGQCPLVTSLIAAQETPVRREEGCSGALSVSSTHEEEGWLMK
jgi:hypothetical protein